MKRKLLSSILSLALLVTLLVIPGGTKTKAATVPSSTVDLVAAMQAGWNLGNSFDALGGETGWGNPVTTKAMIQAVANAGFKSIRIPITWQERIGSAPNYTVNTTFLARVKEVVDWSLDAGLIVMIDMHHDTGSTGWIRGMGGTDHDAILTKFTSVWSQIANYFKNYDRRLLFESLNEPCFDNVDDTKAISLLNELNTAFYKVVRNSGGNNATRALVIPTLYTDNGQTYCSGLYNWMKPLNDSNLVATIHYYGPWYFQDQEAGYDTLNDWVKGQITESIDRAYNTFVKNGIPVIVGEYGILMPDKVSYDKQKAWFTYVTSYCKSKGITHMIWDNGANLNRSTLTWTYPEVKDIAVTSGASQSSGGQTNTSEYLDVTLSFPCNTSTRAVTDFIGDGLGTFIYLNENNTWTLVNQWYPHISITGTSFVLRVKNNGTTTLKFNLKGKDGYSSWLDFGEATLDLTKAVNGTMKAALNYTNGSYSFSY